MPAQDNLDEALISNSNPEPEDEQEIEDLTEQMANDLAECMDDRAQQLEFANIELRWAARAIQTIRLGMFTSGSEFSQINAVFEDRTLSSLNRAMRAACHYLESAFSPKEEV